MFDLLLYAAFDFCRWVMPRKPPLTEREKDIIEILHQTGTTTFKICQKTDRSIACVNKYIRILSGKTNIIKKLKPGRKHEISKTTRRAIGRRASNATTSAQQIKAEYNLQVSTRTVSRALKETPYLKYRTKRRVCFMTDKHKMDRKACCEARRDWDIEWNRVVFSDEKKFNLDGPDGNEKYYHDVRKKEMDVTSRQAGGGSVMFWAGFGRNGKTPIVAINGKQNALKYQETLRLNLLPCIADLATNPPIFQQDRATIHTANSTVQWLRNNNVRTINWPSKGADLNPIENLWGIITREVYFNNKQYRHVDELEAAVITAWNNVSISFLHKLICGMPKRNREVIIANGGSIKR
jgi:transposase